MSFLIRYQVILGRAIERKDLDIPTLKVRGLHAVVSHPYRRRYRVPINIASYRRSSTHKPHVKRADKLGQAYHSSSRLLPESNSYAPTGQSISAAALCRAIRQKYSGVDMAFSVGSAKTMRTECSDINMQITANDWSHWWLVKSHAAQPSRSVMAFYKPLFTSIASLSSVYRRISKSVRSCRYALLHFYIIRMYLMLARSLVKKMNLI